VEKCYTPGAKRLRTFAVKFVFDVDWARVHDLKATRKLGSLSMFELFGAQAAAAHWLSCQTLSIPPDLLFARHSQ